MALRERQIFGISTWYRPQAVLEGCRVSWLQDITEWSSVRDATCYPNKKLSSSENTGTTLWHCLKLETIEDEVEEGCEILRYRQTPTEERYTDVRTQLHAFRKRGDTLHSHCQPLICPPYNPTTLVR